MFRNLAAAAVLLLCAASALAQDSGGVAAPETTRGLILKGRAPAAADVLKVKFPRPKELKLDNGLRIFVMEDHRLPTVRFSLLVKAGSMFETKPGVANFTASQMTEGAGTRDAAAITNETETTGTQLSCSGGSIYSTVTVSGISDNTEQMLSLLTDVVLKPTFPQDRIDRAKQGRGGGGFGGRGGRGPGGPGGPGGGSPEGMAAAHASRLFYAGTPYERTVGGPGGGGASGGGIQSLTRDDLVAWHTKTFVPNNSILSITGDVKTREILAAVKKAFSAWKPGDPAPAIPKAEVKPKDTTRVYVIDRPGSAQTALLFANAAISRTDPDYIPLTVANRILGGGGSARLFQNLREDKGYTYGAYSSLTTPAWPGLWTASASVRTEVTEPAAREFIKEFERIVDQPVTADELARAKRSIVGAFARTLESPEGVLQRFLELVQYDLPMDYWDRYPALIEAVTIDDVQRMARKYLGKGRIQVIAVGERSAIEEGLKKLGPLEVVQPSRPVPASSTAANQQK
jgi:predicted Zn-dependent peptidase